MLPFMSDQTSTFGSLNCDPPPPQKKKKKKMAVFFGGEGGMKISNFFLPIEFGKLISCVVIHNY